MMWREAGQGTGTGRLLGDSQAMRDLRSLVSRAAPRSFEVLIRGETGTGKELVARALHEESRRRRKPFQAVNCAGLSDELVSAELFGHARGAFTGAGDRRGLLAASSGGTIFLDEISELSPRAQATLLRTLQENEVRRIGENRTEKLDLRVVAASNRPLQEEVKAGRFREDLFHRLDVVRVNVPALRERREDIPELATRFWRSVNVETGSRARLSREALTTLTVHDWPGNVRELQNVLARVSVAAPQRGDVGPETLPDEVRAASARRRLTLAEAREASDRALVIDALDRTGGHRTRAAADLGITRQGLAKMMTRLSIDPNRGRATMEQERVR